MCGSQDEGGSPSSLHSCISEEAKPIPKAMGKLTIEIEDSFSTLLELAANNDIKGFRQFIDRDPVAIDEIDMWYGRKKGSNQMVREQRTPLMVAATYGSTDVLKLILTFSFVDVNRVCGLDKSTALHCAASGGSLNALEAVELLLSAGGDTSILDANGDSPADVIVANPKLPSLKITLWEILSSNSISSTKSAPSDIMAMTAISDYNSCTISPPLSSSLDSDSPTAISDFPPIVAKFNEPLSISAPPEKREYAVDPSFPDIKNSMFASDEFRMFSFKVRPCSRAYSHDWTECPFVHPGENARRRDPRKYHYSCVPCPDFRKGACRRGDLCEYAHGVFECWLHPAQYRTRLCKDGTSCTRRVCFFAHTAEELRPLYMSTGSAVPSPRSAAVSSLDMASAMSLLPGSPSSIQMMSPSPFTPPPMSPPANGISNSSLPWPQPNVPTLHLPGSNHQSSRLRSSINARDFMSDDLPMVPDFDELGDFNSIPLQSRLSCVTTNRAARSKSALTPSNLDDLFNDEMTSSPRYLDQTGSVFSPTHKAALLSHFQQQQGMLSPISTNVYSPKAVDQHAILQASVGLASSGRMSPRSLDAVSSMSPRVASFIQREKQQQQLRSLSSRDLFAGSASRVDTLSDNTSMWPKWDSSNGKVDWGVNGEELSKLKRSTFEMGAGGEEPDFSWVQSLVKDSPQENKERVAPPPSPPKSSFVTVPPGENVNASQVETVDHVVLGALLEQMQLDQLVA